jgi:hypothetical protein
LSWQLQTLKVCWHENKQESANVWMNCLTQQYNSMTKCEPHGTNKQTNKQIATPLFTSTKAQQHPKIQLLAPKAFSRSVKDCAY